jgi:dienelactone hydrolase
MQVQSLESNRRVSFQRFLRCSFTWAGVFLFSFILTADQDVPRTLPGTSPLDWEEAEHAAMADRLMDGAHRLVDRKIQEAITRRHRHWNHDFVGGPNGLEAYEASISSARDELARLIGLVDSRLPAVMEHFGDEESPAMAAECDSYQVFQVRWPVLPGAGGVWGEGLLIEPRRSPVGYVVVVPDANQSPEQLMGMAAGLERGLPMARRLADQGFMVVVPTLVNRHPLDVDALDISIEARRRLRASDQTHREWLYRQSYHMGRHIIGYEVQKILAAVEWLKREAGIHGNIGVAGYGEGGMLAFHAAALDTRIDAVLVSGYFESREQTWTEPLDRNIWSLLDRFGDAEIATLIAPRGLVIEHSVLVETNAPKGSIRTPAFDSVQREYDRIASLLPEGFQSRALVHGDGGTTVDPGSTEALAAFATMLGVPDLDLTESRAHDSLLVDHRRGFDPNVRHRRQVLQIENQVQRLVRRSVEVRDRFYGHQALPALTNIQWSTEVVHPTHPPAPFMDASRWYRAYFKDEVQGSFSDDLLPANPRTRLIYQTDQWVGYDVVLDVIPDLVAWGVLLLPRDLKPDERRPVVVVQHGRNGLPENLIVKDHGSYRRVAARLAERGFVVFVPHNLYRNEARYRPLNRKANTVKATLYSFLVHQHDQILRWLNTLDFVAGDRIAFYGNSFGGESALRIPPVLEGYALSISASYFNQWTRKVAGTDDHFSYLFTDEWEVPVFNAGHTFDHAELAYLMVPRPFMVERGHHDHVANDHWVAYEYARVRRLYAMLGLADRTAIDFFQGGHGMRLEGTLRFLHHHLHWPVPASAP